jgi:hypothetical protein
MRMAVRRHCEHMCTAQCCCVFVCACVRLCVCMLVCGCLCASVLHVKFLSFHVYMCAFVCVCMWFLFACQVPVVTQDRYKAMFPRKMIDTHILCTHVCTAIMYSVTSSHCEMSLYTYIHTYVCSCYFCIIVSTFSSDILCFFK